MLTLPLAFDIASPAMLGWLAAAAAPVLIHLWSRRRHREMTWAAMEYLLAALRSSRRKIQLEQLLLLLVRMMLVVSVVTAVAEPLLERGLAFVAGQRTHRLLVIDGSFSMGYRPTDKSRFDQAKELAARIVEESPRGDGFTLVLSGAPPRTVVRTPVFEPRDFLREIENLKLPHATSDLRATLEEVERVLTDARREQPRLQRAAIYFLSDLCRVGWLPEHDSPAASAEIHQRTKRLADAADLVVVDVGQDDAENAAVTDLRTTEPFATVNREFPVEAVLKNFGRQVRPRQKVELWADGRQVRQQYVDLPPGEDVTVPFSDYRFESPGDHALEVRLQSDQLDIDNHRYLSIPVKPAVQVLCVDGRPSGDPLRGATGYLATALAPPGETSGQAAVHVDVVPESALLEAELAHYDCIFLADVAQFTANEAKVLDTYLQGGGGLVFFLGPQVVAERYNRELARKAEGREAILPAELGAVVEKPQHQLDPLDYAHPILRDFRGEEKAGLLTTPVSTYVRLLVPSQTLEPGRVGPEEPGRHVPAPKAKVALRLGNGDPLIVEQPVHRGRVILVATSADRRWTLMPIWPSYPALVQEILSFAIGGQLQQRNLLVGEALGGSLWAAAGELLLGLPDGRQEKLRLAGQGDSSVWSYADTSTSGLYTAQFGTPISRSDLFAVNVDPAESDLARLPPDALEKQIWPGIPFVHQTRWENTGQPSSGHISPRNLLPQGLLYLALALLLLESLLARRFGHHT
jgi:hypothetical protein